MDCPSTPAAPLLSLTLLYASHTTLRYLTRLIFRTRLAHSSPPRSFLVARVNKPQMSQPLRSTPITKVSSLLRTGPPARPQRYSTPHSFCCLTHSLSRLPRYIRDRPSVGSRLLAFRTEAQIRLTPPACRTPP